MNEKTIRYITCKCCGKHFLPRFPNEKYCSLECRDKGRIQRREEWATRNPGYYERLKEKNHDIRKQELSK
jgi:hypothetical protein